MRCRRKHFDILLCNKRASLSLISITICLGGRPLTILQQPPRNTNATPNGSILAKTLQNCKVMNFSVHPLSNGDKAFEQPCSNLANLPPFLHFYLSGPLRSQRFWARWALLARHMIIKDIPLSYQRIINGIERLMVTSNYTRCDFRHMVAALVLVGRE